LSYGFELVRLPAGADPNQAYKKQLAERERAAAGADIPRDPGPIDPSKEQAKQRLAASLKARHPSFEVAQPDYPEIAKSRSVDESEARRLFRNVELNEPELWLQIELFDDAAGASFAFSGPPPECTNALRVLWDCFEILQSEGGFSVFDPQVDKVLDLQRDFDLVLKTACGVDRSKNA
jgi:hypothetical protein